MNEDGRQSGGRGILFSGSWKDISKKNIKKFLKFYKDTANIIKSFTNSLAVQSDEAKE